jgi:hypothetical protein
MLRASLHQLPSRGPAVCCSWRCCGWRIAKHAGVWRVGISAHVVVSQCLVLALLLSSINDTPQLIVNLSSYIEKMSSLFMDVGRSAPRYQEIALLYPRSRKLQSYLNEYFIVVVSLCRYLFKFGQKSTVQQFASTLSDAHLKTFQMNLDKWASSIKEQMDVSEAQESFGFRVLTNVHPYVVGHPVCRDTFSSGPSASGQRDRTKWSLTHSVLHMFFFSYNSLRLTTAWCWTCCRSICL